MGNYIDRHDEADVHRVRNLGWRVVQNNRRASKLRKRGEDIRYSWFYNGWIWDARAKVDRAVITR